MNKPKLWLLIGLVAIIVLRVGIWVVLKVADYPPKGYKVEIIHPSGRYFTNDWRFDESHNCVVFADQHQKHRVLCGDYSMENVQ